MFNSYLRKASKVLSTAGKVIGAAALVEDAARRGDYEALDTMASTLLAGRLPAAKAEPKAKATPAKAKGKRKA